LVVKEGGGPVAILDIEEAVFSTTFTDERGWLATAFVRREGGLEEP